VKSYRVSRDRIARWHIAFAVVTEPIPAPGNGQTVGVDRGVVVSAATSTGDLLRCPGLTGKEAERSRRLQRRLAKATRGSSRRKRVKRGIARLAARVVDRRKDWVEKTSTDLALRFDLISVEAMDVKAMTRSAKGSLEQPGRRVRQKAGLNRAILANSWGQLVARLAHKAAGRLVAVRAAYSSVECSACGHRAAESRESQARFCCRACGFTGHADVNAAINIDNRCRTTLAARGDLQPPGGSVNREPHTLLLPLHSGTGVCWNPHPSVQGGEDVKAHAP
jgi:transposase